MTAMTPTRVLGIALAAAVAVASTAQAGSVENLERERAILIETLLNPDLTPEERHAKTATAQRRLVDLERIVLRDKSLTGRNTPAVKQAFASYDRTFLVHAAAESNATIADHWLSQMGITSQALMSAEKRRR